MSWGDSLGSLPDVAVEPEKIKPAFHPEDFIQQFSNRHFMKNSNQPFKKNYTEEEAAKALGISLLRLHMILDENVFNDGAPRPLNVLLQPSDMVLLQFWSNLPPNPKVVCMPRRPR
ncbi:MAG TPA: hypothetical protein VK738_00420 [Terriglobales bacterium]|nr:hypothetical protein [Terriglobales bacterium]